MYISYRVNYWLHIIHTYIHRVVNEGHCHPVLCLVAGRGSCFVWPSFCFSHCRRRHRGKGWGWPTSSSRSKNGLRKSIVASLAVETFLFYILHICSILQSCFIFHFREKFLAYSAKDSWFRDVSHCLSVAAMELQTMSARRIARVHGTLKLILSLIGGVGQVSQSRPQNEKV